MSEKWEMFVAGISVGVALAVVADKVVGPWLACRLGWCEGRIDYDATGTFWKCSRCGKITR